MDNVIEAILFATSAHGRQTRKFSIEHSLRVAQLTIKYLENEKLVIPALLHDVVEDTNVSIENINNEFGVEVASIVACVTDDKQAIRLAPSKGIYYYEKIRDLHENENYLCIVLKLCDRLDKMIELRKSFLKSAYKMCSSVDVTQDIIEIHDEIRNMCQLMIINTRFVLNYLFAKCECCVILRICKDLEQESDYLFNLINLRYIY